MTTLADIEREMNELLTEHGLVHWRFAWDNATVRAGACHFRTHRITLSRAIFGGSEAARELWRDTALHEIAHALCDPHEAHGPVWYATARRIGCSGRRTHSLPTPPRPIVGLCAPGCPATRDRARYPKPGRFYKCRLCRQRIEWWDRAILESGAIEAGRAVIAASVLAPDPVDDQAARRSAAANKAWETRRRNARADAIEAADSHGLSQIVLHCLLPAPPTRKATPSP